MVSKKKAELLILAAIIIGGLAFVYYKYVLLVQLTQISDIELKIETCQSDMQELSQIKNDTKGALNKISELEKEIETLDITIPDYSGVAEINLQLYHTIKARGLTLTNLEASDPKKDKVVNGYRIKDIYINVIGSEKQVKDFIQYLQNNSRKVKISEANIKVMDTDKLNAIIKTQIFFLHQK